MKEFIIGRREENQRLDKYLRKLLPGAPNGFLYKMLRKKNIVYNGKKASGNEILAEGGCVRLYLSDETFAHFKGDQRRLKDEYDRLGRLPMNGLSVVWEDENCLAANKPAGMLSQKAAGENLSANEYLLGYLIRSGALPLETFATFRPSVCSRLDRNTTGLLLMGKTLAGSQRLSEMLRERTIGKYYRAVVSGSITEEAHLSGYLSKDEKHNRVSVSDEPLPGAKRIETAYRPLLYQNGCTLLEIRLITGKSHQIRAHLAAIGHPVIGDAKYGSEEENRRFRERYGVRYQLLHAFLLQFPDGLTVEAPMPEIYQKIMEIPV